MVADTLSTNTILIQTITALMVMVVEILKADTLSTSSILIQTFTDIVVIVVKMLITSSILQIH